MEELTRFASERASVGYGRSGSLPTVGRQWACLGQVGGDVRWTIWLQVKLTPLMLVFIPSSWSGFERQGTSTVYMSSMSAHAYVHESVSQARVPSSSWFVHRDMASGTNGVQSRVNYEVLVSEGKKVRREQ